MWESNPPGRLRAAYIGFEDRGAHQLPVYLHEIVPIIPYLAAWRNYFSVCGGEIREVYKTSKPRMSVLMSPVFFVT